MKFGLKKARCFIKDKAKVASMIYNISNSYYRSFYLDMLTHRVLLK